MVKNPYDILGVAQGAGMDEIKRAYRKKAKECHPDLHPDDPNANARMQEVNEAYDMLCNPDKYASRQQTGPGANPYGNYGQGYGGYAHQGQRYSQGSRQYAYYSADGEDFWRAWQGMWNDANQQQQQQRRAATPARPFRGLFRVVAGLLIFRFLLSLMRFALLGFFF